MPVRDFYQVSLKAILRNADGLILAVKCGPTSSMAGFYTLPGGRIDEDEFSKPYTDILSRELREELGEAVKFSFSPLPVALGRHLIPAKNSGKINQDIHVLLVFFEAQFLGGNVVISDEHTGFTWLDLNSIVLAEYFISGSLEGLKMYIGQQK